MTIDATSEEHRAFDLINRLVDERAGGVATIERLFGVKLAPAGGSNSYFQISGANLAAQWHPLTRVEIRSATDGSGRGLIDLFLNPNSSGCLHKDFVVRQLGTHFRISVGPPPVDVRNARTSYGWTRPWGTLSVSIRADTPDCISEVVIDYL